MSHALSLLVGLVIGALLCRYIHLRRPETYPPSESPEAEPVEEKTTLYHQSYPFTLGSEIQQEIEYNKVRKYLREMTPEEKDNLKSGDLFWLIPDILDGGIVRWHNRYRYRSQAFPDYVEEPPFILVQYVGMKEKRPGLLLPYVKSMFRAGEPDHPDYKIETTCFIVDLAEITLWTIDNPEKAQKAS